MFTDEARFKKSLNSESGREELKKQTSNILDWSGVADRQIVEKQTTMLLTLLGVHIHSHHGVETFDVHDLDPRVENQHEALIDIIKNVRTWLTKDAVEKIIPKIIPTISEITQLNMPKVTPFSKPF